MGNAEQEAFDEEFISMINAHNMFQLYGPRQEAFLDALDHRLASGPPLSDADKKMLVFLAGALNISKIPEDD